MLDAIRQMMRHGDATISYPEGGVPPLPRNYRGQPIHDDDKCMCCAACANQCPPNAIQMLLQVDEGTETWSINYGRCIFCGRCQEVCPTTAITLSDRIELAALDKDDLEVTATYELERCSSCGRYFATKKEVDYVAKVLSAGDEEMTPQGARYIASRCSRCKAEADAMRASYREHTTGQPAAYTADQALHDVYAAPMLNKWASESEAGDVEAANDDLVIDALVKRGILTEEQVSDAREQVEEEVRTR